MAGVEDEFLELRLLREAFPQLSLKSIVAAYNAADGSVDAAAGALEQQTCEIKGSEDNGASLVAHEKCEETLISGQVLDEDHEGSPRNVLGRSRSRKWTTVARSGTVSSVRACSDTGKKRKRKQHKKKKMNGLEEPSPKQEEGVPKKENKELEEFLLSMLGGELGMDVVRDVIYECGGDAQKSLDSLLAFMSGEATVDEREVEGRNDLFTLWEAFPDQNPEDLERIYKEHGSHLELATNKLLDVNQLTKGKESSYQVLATEVICQEVLCKLKSSFPSVDPKTLEEVLKTTENDFSAAMNYLSEAGLAPMKEVAQGFLKKVLKPPDPEASNWTEVKVKPKAPRRPLKIDGKVSKNGRDGPELEHTSAVEYWSMMKDYFLKATSAYSSGHRSLASHLSEKGREYKQLALEARERESKRIFRTKNKCYDNNITIDLHAQHVDEALRLFKLHLDALQAITSVHTLTVITGCGNHAANGKPKLKPAIIAYMNRKGLKWSEVNPGCLVLDLHS